MEVENVTPETARGGTISMGALVACSSPLLLGPSSIIAAYARPADVIRGTGVGPDVVLCMKDLQEGNIEGIARPSDAWMGKEERMIAITDPTSVVFLLNTITSTVPTYGGSTNPGGYKALIRFNLTNQSDNFFIPPGGGFDAPYVINQNNQSGTYGSAAQEIDLPIYYRLDYDITFSISATSNMQTQSGLRGELHIMQAGSSLGGASGNSDTSSGGGVLIDPYNWFSTNARSERTGPGKVGTVKICPQTTNVRLKGYIDTKEIGEPFLSSLVIYVGMDTTEAGTFTQYLSCPVGGYSISTYRNDSRGACAVMGVLNGTSNVTTPDTVYSIKTSVLTNTMLGPSAIQLGATAIECDVPITEIRDTDIREGVKRIGT